MTATDDKDKKLQRLTALWDESRKEIRQRIEQRDRYVIQMIVGFVAVIAASKFVPGIWMLCSLPLYYYSLMTYHSYLIHKQLSFYMSEHLEKKIHALLKGKDFDYLEYESFFKLAESVGVRQWLFVWVPSLVSISLLIISYKYSASDPVLNWWWYLLFLGVVSLFWGFSIYLVKRKMKVRFNKKNPSLGIIGDGEVVRKKYLPLLAAGSHFRTVEVIGFGEEQHSYSLKSMESRTFERVAYHRDPPDIWVIATPTPTHFHYYQLVKNMGCKVAVEKPATIDLEQYKVMRGTDLSHNRSCNWFPLAYYLLEKGLPLLLLLNEEFEKNAGYGALITVTAGDKGHKAPTLASVRQKLGLITAFKGVIFEGTSANSLSHRAWVLQKDGGGNLWETLFHLACMSSVAAAFNNHQSGIVQKLDIKTMHRFTYDIEGKPSDGDIGAYAELNAGQRTNWLIATAKGVAPSLNKREARLTFSSGHIAVMDFSTCTLTLYPDHVTQQPLITISLTNKRKYHSQFALMKHWLAAEGNSLLLPMKAYDDAMNLTAKMAGYDVVKKPDMKDADVDKLLDLGWSAEIFSS